MAKWVVVLAVMACRGSERSAPGPDPGAAPSLRAFSCTKQVGGKRENGLLEITFVPTTPDDVSFHVQFRGARPACNYATDIRLVAGRLNDGFLGRAYTYRCGASPLSAFAVSCGPYLGTDLTMVVHGDSSARTLAFRVPWSFHDRMPDADVCTLPFVGYDGAGHAEWIDNDEIVFDLADCHWEA